MNNSFFWYRWKVKVFEQNREQMRQYFLQVWDKHQQQQPLEPLEAIVRDVIVNHPEYQAQLKETNLTTDYHPEIGETNPFLHLGLHIALHEQLSMDRPTGIRAIYQQLAEKIQDKHATEHQMMACLAQSLWEAQSAGRMPSETNYLACLTQLIN